MALAVKGAAEAVGGVVDAADTFVFTRQERAEFGLQAVAAALQVACRALDTEAGVVRALIEAGDVAPDHVAAALDHCGNVQVAALHIAESVDLPRAGDRKKRR